MTINYWYEFAKIDNIKPITKYRIIKVFKHPSNFYNTKDFNILKTNLITRKQLQYIRNIDYSNNIDEYLFKKGISIINIVDQNYPILLKNIYDPPITLFLKGNISLINKKMIAMVGSRKGSYYGLKACSEISEKLSTNNYVIVSGMANGIDTMAHKSAYKNKTIAVLGFGHDYCYPNNNRILKKSLEENSLTISEYVPSKKPEKYHFPARNRIISGLSFATIIIEASIKSGSLITAGFTIENNRELFVLPHNLYSNSDGCNYLIRDGANIITSIDELCEEIKNVEIC